MVKWECAKRTGLFWEWEKKNDNEKHCRKSWVPSKCHSTWKKRKKEIEREKARFKPFSIAKLILCISSAVAVLSLLVKNIFFPISMKLTKDTAWQNSFMASTEQIRLNEKNKTKADKWNSENGREKEKAKEKWKKIMANCLWISYLYIICILDLSVCCFVWIGFIQDICFTCFESDCFATISPVMPTAAFQRCLLLLYASGK